MDPENNADVPLIGKLISALSNAARLADQHFVYVVWGVRDGDHAVVGTNFEPTVKRKQGQPLEIRIASRLSPGIEFRFEEVDHDGLLLILLTIPSRVIRTALDAELVRPSDPERSRAGYVPDWA